MALARALAVEPKMLLLDEPFGALDTKVRKELRRWLRRLHDELHITSILVTHDQEEALEAADRIVVLNQGCIEQIGTPDEVYETPGNTVRATSSSAMSTCFMAASLKTETVHEESGRATRGETLRTNTKSPLSVPTTWNSAGAGPRRHSWKQLYDLSSPQERESGSELVLKDSPQPIAVELTKERYRELNLQQGDVAFVHPKQLQVFKNARPLVWQAVIHIRYASIVYLLASELLLEQQFMPRHAGTGRVDTSSILERSHLQTPDGTDHSGRPWQVWIKRSSLH